MKNHCLKTLLLIGLLCGISGQVSAAENSIKQIQVRREGEQLLLKVQLTEKLKSVPGNWSVLQPPRIVFDFPDTDNRSGQTTIPIANGDLKSLNLVQTEKLTRMVINLTRSNRYSAELIDDALLIRLSSESVAAGQEPTPSVYQPVVTKAKTEAIAPTDLSTVRDITFRRGEDGQATITVDLTDSAVPIDVRRNGNGITVELRDVELPERLQNRRDVNDFATPVTQMTSRNVGTTTRMEITARGRWFHQSRLANNQLIIEVKPIPADEINKLVQAGQQGQKVSINFFAAEATMVLRTLADISGKNVMIDPSLNGKTITVNLDNISYDQALEIIMAQVNASMRVTNDVILFGDRAVLLKRDQDVADETTRANDLAPLVTETFKLNYVKTAEVLSLVSAGLSQTATVTLAAGAAAAPAAGATSTSSSAKGMLSARGSISAHDTSNQIFLRDTAVVVEAIREVIRNIDLPPKQVMIEARIVEAVTGFNEAFGVRLRTFDANASGQGGQKVPFLADSSRFALGTASGLTNVNLFGTTAAPSLTRTSNQGIGTGLTLTGASTINMMLFNTAATRLLTLELAASESDSKTKTISAPRIMTMNRKAATINNTTTVNLVSTNASTGVATILPVSAPIKLTVTPAVNPDSRITLELDISKSSITNATTGSTSANTLTTSVIVENGGTLVIGGLATESDTEAQERVPFFGDLPYVGFLFKSTTRVKGRTELLVFITPRIVGDALTQR